jgi:aspartyl-tRNA(Asn)/glutamyl-tRNA(Gln) amidotransferase subunit A
LIDWPVLKAANAPLNAFVDWDESAAPGHGPLDDLAIGVKSNIAVKGLPWTAGMALHRDRIAASDAAVVARLRKAGATILGTLNMHEAALGATTDNPWFGRSFNPHGHGRTPGGSSGGSGAAVAARLCDAALGTDTLGSVRIPAAYNGVYGLKPTAGALPDDGLEPLHRGFDVIGPLARSLPVLERVWHVLRDSQESRSSPQAYQVLVLSDLGEVACEPAVLAGYERMLARLPGVGTVSLPPLPRVRIAGFVEAARALSAALGPDRRPDLLSPELRWLLDFGDAAPRDPPLLDDVRNTLTEALGDNGVLIMPTAPQAAFLHGGLAPANQADFTCLANIAGLPALAIPAGRDADGMPVGVQIVGPAGSEALLFAVARTLDQGDS